MPDDDDPQMPGQKGWMRLAGLSSPAGADCDGLFDGELLSPSLGYGLLGAGLCRLGFPEPYHGLRVSAPGRFEYRSVDSMVNPYLMGTTLLAAMDDGIDNKLDPGEPEERNIYEAIKEGKEVKKLPMSLGEALSISSKRSGAPRHAGRDVRCIHEYKSDEWARFMSTSPIGTMKPIWNACHKAFQQLYMRRVKPPPNSDVNEGAYAMCGIAGLIHRRAKARMWGGNDQRCCRP